MLHKVSKNNSVVFVLDIQKDSTDPAQYLGKSFFNGEVSATREQVTSMWDFASAVKNRGWKVLVIKLVHDLEKMKMLDKQRYDNQQKLGLVKEGKPLIFAPDLTEFDFANSEFRPDASEIYEKCSRSVCKDPTIMKALDSSGVSIVILLGIDSNVCVYESARDLSSTYRVFVLQDLVSTRSSAKEDFENKRIELEKMGIIFINSGELVSQHNSR